MLTPVDIENKEFGKAFRGYDIEEVEEFLQTLVTDYEKLYRESVSLKEKNAMLQETISNYRGMEETMQNAILAAQRAAEDIKRNAYHRAENITREAQTRANESIASADRTIQELENSYLALQGEVDAYRARMRSLLETNLKLLDDMPRVELKSIERVKVDPVVIDSVEHTAPVPNVEQNAATEVTEDTVPIPGIEKTDFAHAEQAVENNGASVPESTYFKPVDDQRVPLSDKIPVAQATRGTHINPLIDQLMKENKHQPEETEKESESEPEEKEPSDFGVKKETVDAFDFEGKKEILIHVDKKNIYNKKEGADSSYFDVFADDTL